MKKKSSSKYLTIALALSMVTTILALPSCKSVEAVTSDTHNLSLIAHSSHHDTVVLRDSIFVREVMRGDTVYLTRTEWRDRWRVRVVHDTVRHTEYVDRVVEKPPERYVPKFYKWSAAILWALLIFFILRFFFAFKL